MNHMLKEMNGVHILREKKDYKCQDCSLQSTMCYLTFWRLQHWQWLDLCKEEGNHLSRVSGQPTDQGSPATQFPKQHQCQETNSMLSNNSIQLKIVPMWKVIGKILGFLFSTPTKLKISIFSFTSTLTWTLQGSLAGYSHKYGSPSKTENGYKGHYFEVFDSVLGIISAPLKRLFVNSVFRISPINSLR